TPGRIPPAVIPTPKRPTNKNDGIAMIMPPIMTRMVTITPVFLVIMFCVIPPQVLCPASYATFVLFAGRVAACWRHSVATKPCRAGLHPLQVCQRVAGCWIYAQSQRQIDHGERSKFQTDLETVQTAWKRFYFAISR